LGLSSDDILLENKNLIVEKINIFYNALFIMDKSHKNSQKDLPISTGLQRIPTCEIHD